MANYTISNRLKTHIVKEFKDALTTTNLRNVAYVYIGKHLPYANDSVVEDSTDTEVYQRFIWDNMIAGKKITAGDLEFVIPKKVWLANTIYKQYDDQSVLTDLLVDDASSNAMYILTSGGNVYKCLGNNSSGLSTDEPTGDYSSSNGFITTTDNYLWKYMYNIKDSNKFLTTDWIPAPYSANDVIATEYGLDPTNLVQGSLNEIVVTSGGTGYTHTTLNVSSFLSGNSTLNLSNGSSTTNLVVNMSVSGVGILSGTYITGISAPLNRITLSNPTIGAGGGANTVQVNTRIAIVGDGTGGTFNVAVSNGSVSKITVLNSGTNYTKANVIIYGSGTGANARTILSPKYGHGYSPAREFAAKDLMIDSKIGDVDSTEGGLIPIDTSFRQYGILTKPHKYGENYPVEDASANSVVSQTLDLTLISGANYTTGEEVYQGSLSNKTFYGYVISQTSLVVKLSNTYGTLVKGKILIGANSGTNRPVVSSKNPDFQPYSGDIVYNKNILEVQRADGQAEEIKLVINF